MLRRAQESTTFRIENTPTWKIPFHWRKHYDYIFAWNAYESSYRTCTRKIIYEGLWSVFHAPSSDCSRMCQMNWVLEMCHSTKIHKIAFHRWNMQNPYVMYDLIRYDVCVCVYLCVYFQLKKRNANYEHIAPCTLPNITVTTKIENGYFWYFMPAVIDDDDTLEYLKIELSSWSVNCNQFGLKMKWQNPQNWKKLFFPRFWAWNVSSKRSVLQDNKCWLLFFVSILLHQIQVKVI